MPPSTHQTLLCLQWMPSYLPWSGHGVSGGVVDAAGDVEATEELQVPDGVAELVLR